MQTLFDWAEPAKPSKSTQAKFNEYHARNPHVYELFKRFAFQAIQSGRGNFGARAIMERLRWYVNFETEGEPFKISNNHTPYYVRLFDRDFPQHREFFRKKPAIADREKNDAIYS